MLADPLQPSLFGLDEESPRPMTAVVTRVPGTNRMEHQRGRRAVVRDPAVAIGTGAVEHEVKVGETVFMARHANIGAERRLRQREAGNLTGPPNVRILRCQRQSRSHPPLS